MKGTDINYRPEIDGLRAIAVSAVVFFHAFPLFFKSGYVGVDIFFVISGFLITSIIRKEANRNTFSLIVFYKKRVRRIYPALIIVILSIIFLSWMFMSDAEYWFVLKHVIVSSFFSENLLLWNEDGYFDKASILKPTLHLWSLSVEEQFYILWPLLICFFVRKKVEVRGVFLLLILSLILNVYDVSHGSPAAYYSPLGRAWELMVGSLLAILSSDYKVSISPKATSAISALGLFIIILSIFFIPSEKGFPGFFAIPVVLGAAIVIYFSNGGFVFRLLSLKPIVFIGLISYPLYLIHWPLISFSYLLLDHSSSKANAACLVVSFLLASAIYLFVEKKIAAKNLNISVILFFIMIAIPLVAFFLIGTQSRIGDINFPKENEWSFLIREHKSLGVVGFDDRNGVGTYRSGSQSSNEIAFIGDSHVANFAELIFENHKIKNYFSSVTMGVGGGCIPIPDVYTEDKSKSGCWKNRDEYLKYLRSDNVKTVVIGGAWYMYFRSKDDYFYMKGDKKYYLKTKAGESLAVNSLISMIVNLKHDGKNVFFIKDAPYITGVTPGFGRLKSNPDSYYKSDVNTKIDREQFDFISLLAEKAEKAGAGIINIYDNVCNESNCGIVKGGEYLYVSAGHFNPSWLRNNRELFDNLLNVVVDNASAHSTARHPKLEK